MSWLARLRICLMAAVSVSAGVIVLAAVQSAGGDAEPASPATITPVVQKATSVPTRQAAVSAPTSTPTPSPAAPMTPTFAAATPTATPTATPVASTPTPTAAPSRAPAVRGPSACPVTQHICDLAIRYRRMLVAADIEGLVASPRGYRISCPAPQAASGPYPLCTGLPGGSELGYARTSFESPDGASDREGLRQRFREWLGEPAGAASDAFGPGDIRIVSVGCGARAATDEPTCGKEIDLLFTRIAAAGRVAMLIRLTPADNFANDGITGMASGKAPDTAYTGGTLSVGNANGALFASVALLQPWAPADIGLP